MQPSGTSAADQLKRDIDTVRRDLTELIRKVNFTSLRDETSDLDTRIANFPMRIQQVRERKYAFNRVLESQALEYQKQWAAKRGKSKIRSPCKPTVYRLSCAPLNRGLLR